MRSPPDVPARLNGALSPTDRSKQLAFDLARAKRAINRGQFSEAETVAARDHRAHDPGSAEAAYAPGSARDAQRARNRRARYRILRDWFPSGKVRRNAHDGARDARSGAWRFSACFSRWSPPASTFDPKDSPMLYLTGVLTVAALFYLAYVMILPEKF